MPAYPLLGNHEYPSSQNPALAPQLFLDYFELPGDERFYSFNYGSVHFVALDVYQNSDAPDNWRLTASQYAWLESDLANAQASGMPWTVVTFHHPALSSAASTSRPWESPLQTDLFPLFDAYGVDYVVMGHHHLYNRSNRKGITYIITGGGGAALQAISTAPFSVNPNHHRLAVRDYEYLLFEATAARMTMVAKKSDGTEIDREIKSNQRRNIILVIGDGMGFEHIQAGRLYTYGSDADGLGNPNYLNMEDPAKFPYAAQEVTTLPGGGITDSATAATAIATGYQHTANGIISEASGIKTTILELARDNGQRTGLITTAAIVDATPAAFGAHDNNRSHYTDLRWDYLLDDDASRPDGDHARTFPEIIFGGGSTSPTYAIDTGYLNQAASRGYTVIDTRAQLYSLNINLEPRVLGVFDKWTGTGLLIPEKDRIDNVYPLQDEPTLADMLSRAIDQLEEGAKGLFVLVEDEQTDELSHANRSTHIAAQVRHLDLAVAAALDWVAATGSGAQTLVLVTADHETGGLDVPEGQNIVPGSAPALTWSTTGHTATNVPVYATGPATIAAQVIDNTEIFRVLEDHLYGGRPPLVTNVAVANITSNSATVSWNTDELSDSRVDYGVTDSYGAFAEDPAHSRVSSHSLALAGLSPNTLYHFRAASLDLSGYAGQSADGTFWTTGPPPAPPAGLLATDTSASIQLDWQDSPEPQVIGYNVYRSAAPGGPYTGLNTDAALVLAGSAWRYHDQGMDLGTAWRGAGYNDSAWASGLAELGYGDGGEATVISYGPDPNNKYPTYYFRKAFEVADPAAYDGLTLRLKRDDGAVVYLNGAEVRRDNMPSGTITFNTWASAAIGGADETTFFQSSVPATNLVAGANVIAVEVHQANGTSSDVSFDLELLASGQLAAQSNFTDAGAPSGANRYYVVTAVDGSGQESAPSAEVCAVRGVPAAPANLSAAAGDGSASLTWAANPECDLSGYGVYRGTAPGGPYVPLTPAPIGGMTYQDTGLNNGQTYYYVVTAVDRSGQESAASNETSATPEDTTPPVLSAIAAFPGETTAAITWTTDEPADSQVDYGLTASYGSAASGAALVTSHSIALSGLLPNTLYHYRLTSRDAALNAASSADLTFTTSPDQVPPAISDVAAVPSDRSATVFWATDEPADSLVDYGLTSSYDLFAQDPLLATSHAIVLAGLEPMTEYHYRITSRDSSGNASSTLDATFTTAADTFPPDTPAGLAAAPGINQVDLTWNASAAADLAGYRVYRSTVSGSGYALLNGSLIAGPSYADTTVLQEVTYYYVVAAVDASGNESGASNEASGRAIDQTAPAAPSGLLAAGGESQVSLDWNDNGEPDLSGYDLYRSTAPGSGHVRINGPLLTASNFVDTAVVVGTAYYYYVVAVDNSGNESAPSAEASATPVDTTPPAVPAGLAAAPGDGAVLLDWNDNSDPDLATYRIYRSTASGGPYSLIAAPLASNYFDSGLTNGIAYFYAVSAVDIHGNESPKSGEVAATPVDMTPPAAPADLAAAASDDAIALDWLDNADPDLGGYNVYRSTTSGSGFVKLNAALVSGSGYADAAVLRGGTYYYRVTAVDDTGNESSPSAEASSATPGFYLSFAANVTVPKAGGGTMTVPDEDIVRYDPVAGAYTLYFDGTAAGLASNQDIDGFDILSSGQILISLDSDSSVSGLGAVDDSDVLIWTPGAGSRYPGIWAWYFDGSDVGLTTSNEDVDAVTLLPGGKLLISTIGSASAGGLSWADEDLMAFTFSGSPGPNTAGAWAWHFDGSDVGLSDLDSEDVWGSAPRLSGSAFYLTVQGAYSVAGLPSGSGVDVLLFTPTSLGAATAGSYALAFDGSASGLSDSSTIDGLDLAF
ncbi:MAG: alkaline phosphatase [Planctomycetes bacterium]|nr:alkaline phosphatase [Planctomycetota bacterium]